jgi:hypothetical protein
MWLPPPAQKGPFSLTKEGCPLTAVWDACLGSFASAKWAELREMSLSSACCTGLTCGGRVEQHLMEGHCLTAPVVTSEKQVPYRNMLNKIFSFSCLITIWTFIKSVWWRLKVNMQPAICSRLATIPVSVGLIIQSSDVCHFLCVLGLQPAISTNHAHYLNETNGLLSGTMIWWHYYSDLV